MEGFKPTIKMKTGGSVSKAVAKCYGGAMKKKTGGKMDAADIKQDKAIVKKAFKMHDEQEHGGERTDLSKLKKGGRSKKEVGTVRKYKSGGEVTNVYEAKKASGDKDNIKKVKQIKPAKAAAPSKASVKPNYKGSDVSKEKSKPAGHKDATKKVKEDAKKAAAPSGAKGPDPFKKGGAAKKYADGGSVLTDLKNNILGTPEQNRVAQANMDKQAAAGSKLAKFFGGNPANAPKPVTKKAGGKIAKMADGGLSPDQQAWLGGADATDPFILARMRAAVPNPKSSYISADTDNRDIGAAPAPVAAPVSTPAPVAAPVRRPAPVIEAGPSADDRLRAKYGRDMSDADSRLRAKYGKSEWDQTNVPLPKVSEWDNNSIPLPEEGISQKLARILGFK